MSGLKCIIWAFYSYLLSVFGPEFIDQIYIYIDNADVQCSYYNTKLN